jgi:hypothetical protein
MDLTWLDNAVTAVEGEEHLRTHILRAGSVTRWLATTCCHSVLVMSHPKYNGNVVAVPRVTCTLKCDDTTLPVVRIQTREWSARKVGEGYPDESNMPKFTGQGQAPSLDGRSFTSVVWQLWRRNFLKALGVAPHREEGDRTIEQLMAGDDFVPCRAPLLPKILLFP